LKKEESCKNLMSNYKVLHGENSFAEVSKNLAGYRSENNFVRIN